MAKTTPKKNFNKVANKRGYDLDKLAIAVATAETGNCKKGSAIRYKNCFGIMEWVNGKRRLKKYATYEDSFKDFKRIWNKSYKKYPTYRMAEKYTGKDRTSNWMAIVNQTYNKI